MDSTASSLVPPPIHRAPRGSTLAATMMVVAAIVSFLSIAALITSQFGRYTARQQGTSDQAACCDAALEYAYAQWMATINTYMTNHGISGANAAGPAVTDCTPNTSGAPNTMRDAFNTAYNAFAKNGVVCDQLIVEACDINGVPKGSGRISDVLNGSVSNVDYTHGSDGQLNQNVPGYPGWLGNAYNYRVTVKVSYNQGSYSSQLGGAHMGVNLTGKDANNKNTYDMGMTVVRYFQFTSLPLFQAAIFYENKLELHPGSTMTVKGVVHTNNDMWAQGFADLTFKDAVSYVGSFHQDADSSVTTGWDGYYNYYPLRSFPADGNMITWNNGAQYASPATPNNSQLNKVAAIDPFGGVTQTNNALHKIIEVPDGTATGLGATQIAYNNAAVRITVNSSLLPTDPNYVTVAVTAKATNNPNTNLPPDPVAIAAAVSTTSTTITDWRETTPNMRLTNVNMYKLSKATTGLVYIRDIAPIPTGSSLKTGIRLQKGATLKNDITIASDTGVYIQGDYNTGSAVLNSDQSDAISNLPALVPSNVTTDAANTVGSSYTWRSSAVIADAVTILSNNWLDGRSNNAMSMPLFGYYVANSRDATPTTVNTAIMAGDVPSNTYAGIASGGAHNFPRFLENWNGKNFTYYGSLVEAFNSKKFTGAWQTYQVYSWPDRIWHFDTNFTNLRQPPGTVSGMKFTRGRWQQID